MPRGCLQPVDVLSDEAVVEARSRLNPAAGVMLSALWVASDGPVGVDRSPSGRRRGVVANSVGGPQHCLGPAPQRPAGGVAGGWDLVCPVVGAAGRACAPAGSHRARRRLAAGRRLPRPRCRRCNPRWIPMPPPGNLSVTLDTETTQMLLGEVPTAFHAGIHDILLIAFALGVGGVSGQRRRRRSASTSRVTGATMSSARMSTCRAPWAGSPPNTRWHWQSAG